jgi:hypothetical protein
MSSERQSTKDDVKWLHFEGAQNHSNFLAITIDDEQDAVSFLAKLVGGQDFVEADRWLSQTFLSDEMFVSGTETNKIPRWKAPATFTTTDGSTLYHILLTQLQHKIESKRILNANLSHVALTWILRALFWIDVLAPSNNPLEFHYFLFSGAVKYSPDIAYAMLDLPSVYNVQFDTGLGNYVNVNSSVYVALTELKHIELAKALLRNTDSRVLNARHPHSLFSTMITAHSTAPVRRIGVMKVLNEATSERVVRNDGSGLCLHHLVEAEAELKAMYDQDEPFATRHWQPIMQEINFARKRVLNSTSRQVDELRTLFHTQPENVTEWILPLPSVLFDVVIDYVILKEYIISDHLSCCAYFKDMM